MADPQTTPAASTSQELPQLARSPQEQSEEQTSGPANLSGAARMSMSDGKAEEAGPSSPAIISPETTEPESANGESSNSEDEDNHVEEVSYLDGTMFWMRPELRPKQWRRKKKVSPFLMAPQDHRLCLGYLENWKDIGNAFLYKKYRSGPELGSIKGVENSLMELQDFIEDACAFDDVSDDRARGCFIIRDADLEGHNRVYNAEEEDIGEYNDGPMFGNQVTKEGGDAITSTNLKVPNAKWQVYAGKRLSDPPPTPSPAPWRRICLLQGLNAIKPLVCGSLVLLPFMADQDDIILGHLKGGQFFKPLSEGVIKLAHGFPLAARRSIMALQFSWYRRVPWTPLGEITDAADGINGEKIKVVSRTIQWRVGNLYGKQRVQKTTYTAQAIQNPTVHGDAISYNGDYWTVLVLAPEDMYGGLVNDASSLRRAETLFGSTLHRLPIVMLHRAVEALDIMIEDWSKILDYVDEVLGDQDLILLPDEHNHLLEDNDSGSRAKMYFWVINSLTAFRSMMDENNQVYLNFKSAEIEDPQPDYSDEELQIVEEADKSIASFARLGTRTDAIRRRATVLLNSLFNAISVAESHKSSKLAEDISRLTKSALEENKKSTKLGDNMLRLTNSTLEQSKKSTRLGQNVMLLTYVSIFYLPLSFCTSLWATTSTFGFHNLIGVMVATAVATYVIVFNLKRISEFHQGWRRKLGNSMLSDPGWEDLGGDLTKPSPDDDKLEASEWWVIVYFVRSLFKNKRSEVGGKKPDGGTAVAAAPDGHDPKDSTSPDNVGKSGESRTESNENVPKQPLFKERAGHADGSKVEGENSKGASKQTITPPKRSWFHLSWSRVLFTKHSEDKEEDIERQKAGLISETDTGNGKGENTAGASVRREKEVEKGKGIEIV